MELKSIIEAFLFSSQKPLTAGDLREVCRKAAEFELRALAAFPEESPYGAAIFAIFETPRLVRREDDRRLARQTGR